MRQNFFALVLVALVWATPAAAAAPSVALHLSPGDTVAKEHPVMVEWNVENVPANSSIAFFLIPDVPEDERRWHLGLRGPLSLTVQSLKEHRAGRFEWDGKSVGCAPTDQPMFCTGIQPGNYRIEAAVYDRVDVQLLGYPRFPDEKPNIVAKASAPLVVTGEYDFEPLKSRLVRQVVYKTVASIVDMPYQYLRLERYVKMRGELSGPDPDGKYCAVFDLQPPFSGVLTACSPKTTHPNDLTISGDVHKAEGVLAYADALAKAHALADTQYKTHIRPGTYLGTQDSGWVYRADGGYWLFVIAEFEAGSKESLPDRFEIKAMVKVPNSGNACIVKTVAARQGMYQLFNDDFFTGRMECSES